MEVTILGQAAEETTEDRTRSLAAGLPILLSEFTDKIYVAVDNSLAFEIAREYHTIGSGEVVGIYTSNQHLDPEQERSLDLKMEVNSFYDLRGSLASKTDPIIVVGLSPEVVATISLLASKEQEKQPCLIIFEPTVEQQLPDILAENLSEVRYVRSLSDVEEVLRELSTD